MSTERNKKLEFRPAFRTMESLEQGDALCYGCDKREGPGGLWILDQMKVEGMDPPYQRIHFALILIEVSVSPALIFNRIT